jgi:hypothetical protein
VIRLGLHISLRTGREALVRLLVTAAAVGIGVGLLLSVLAIYHGYEVSVHRACWSCSAVPQSIVDGPPESTTPSITPADDAELWNFTEDYHRGRLIERLDVAALGPNAPVVPGLSQLPAAGQYVVSPALAALLDQTPAGELGDRFPGTRTGLIGAAGLAGPDELVVIVGRTPAELAQLPNTTRITAIQTTPRSLGTTIIYRLGFGLGAVALLLPMLVLIGNATRLAAARREERYAAMRLVGATPRQVSQFAAVDAAVGALLGSVVGVGIFALLQPLAANLSITGARFFATDVTPTVPGYAAVLLGVPAAAAVTAVLSLWRVNISPLGVSRRTTPRPPRAWRVVPLAVGVVVFTVPLTVGPVTDGGANLAVLGLAVIMVGLLVGGTWLAMQAARGLGRFSGGPSSLLAARRMADNPRAAFRSVSGLVLAVFVGTFLAGAVPAALVAQQTPTDAGLGPVLRLQLDGPAGPQEGGTVAAELGTLPGVSVLPLYHNPAPAKGFGPPPTIIGCAALAPFSVLGSCAPGVTAVEATDSERLFTDNLANLNGVLPLVTPDSPPVAEPLAALGVSGLLVHTDSAATTERVRTFVARHHPGLIGSGFDNAPQTFAEVAQVRAVLYTKAQNVMLFVVAMTLLVAGCSLAIAAGGGIVERRRPFTLLRVAGTATPVLRRVVLLESVLPLAVATIVAAVTGFGAAVPVNNILTPPGDAHHVALPGGVYYLTLGAGLLVSLAVILATLPLLNRITRPHNVRFE